MSSQIGKMSDQIEDLKLFPALLVLFLFCVIHQPLNIIFVALISIWHGYTRYMKTRCLCLVTQLETNFSAC